MSITVIARDTLLKLVGGQMVHQLSEDSLAEIHPSLSERRRGPNRGRWEPPIAPEKIQIEKTEFSRSFLISQWVIPLTNNLAGQQ
jgi:hypothetical protein